MPRIDQYLGIIFIINTGREHPPPHVHVVYNEYKGTINIKTGVVMEGDLPPRIRKLAGKWIEKNRAAVLGEWERMERGETPRPIKNSTVKL